MVSGSRRSMSDSLSTFGRRSVWPAQCLAGAVFGRRRSQGFARTLKDPKKKVRQVIPRPS
jgi:hypothetical protein